MDYLPISVFILYLSLTILFFILMIILVATHKRIAESQETSVKIQQDIAQHLAEISRTINK